jgi:hypothetical protein
MYLILENMRKFSTNLPVQVEICATLANISSLKRALNLSHPAAQVLIQLTNQHSDYPDIIIQAFHSLVTWEKWQGGPERSDFIPLFSN